MLAVVRHEATHVIVAGLYGYSPVWFNEGLAEYFEYLKVSGQRRKVEPVAYHLAHLRRLLKRGELIPLYDMFSSNRNSGMEVTAMRIMHKPGHWFIF